MGERRLRIIYQTWSVERLAFAVTHRRAEYRPEAVTAMLEELGRRGVAQGQIAALAEPPPPTTTQRPRVLAGWRIIIFVYLILGGVWFAWPGLASLYIHTKEPQTIALGIVAGVLFVMGLSLFIFALVVARGMATNQARALRSARSFCIGKLVYAILSLTAAAFIFRHWGFTSPPEALSSIIFAALALLYLMVSRKVRALIAAG